MQASRLFLCGVIAVGIVLEGHDALAACTPTAVPATSIPTWKPPQKGSGCTAADATAFDAALDNPNDTADALEQSVSAACRACAFTEDATGANWQLFVWLDKSQNSGALNPSACIVASGASADCGAAFFDTDTCDSDACQTCDDATTYNACVQSAENATCSQYANQFRSACTNSAPFTACGYTQTSSPSKYGPLLLALCGGSPSGGSTSSDGGTLGSGGGTSSGSQNGNKGSNNSANGGTNGGGSSEDDLFGGQDDMPQDTTRPSFGGGCSTGGANGGPSGTLLTIGLGAIAIAVARRTRKSR